MQVTSVWPAGTRLTMPHFGQITSCTPPFSSGFEHTGHRHFASSFRASYITLLPQLGQRIAFMPFFFSDIPSRHFGHFCLPMLCQKPVSSVTSSSHPGHRSMTSFAAIRIPPSSLYSCV